MSEQKLNAIVVGAGKLGTFHAQKYQALKAQGVYLVALVDPDVAKVQQNFPGVPVFATLQECLKAEEQNKISNFQIASVATPTVLHVEIAEVLLKADKHVLVEKPLSSKADDGRRLIALARKLQKKLAVGQVERFRTAEVFQSIKDPPRFIECHRLSTFPARSTDIDVVLDLMIHDIDLMLSIVASPIKIISAAGFPVLTPMVDIANTRFEFEDGCVANLTSSRISVTKTRKFRVFYANAYLSIDLQSGNYELFRRNPKATNFLEMLQKESAPLKVEDPLQAEIENFVQAVRYDQEPLVSGEAGLRAQEVAEQVAQDIQRRIARIR